MNAYEVKAGIGNVDFQDDGSQPFWIFRGSIIGSLNKILGKTYNNADFQKNIRNS